MGVAVMLLVFLLGPTVCAQLSGCSFSYMLEKFAHQIDEFLGGENEMKMIQNIPEAIEEVIERVTREPQRQKKYMTSYIHDVYVPKVPRRPIILVWPSVMNPAVTKAVEKKLRHREQNKAYLKIECSVNERVSMFEIHEIRKAIDKFDESNRARKFFKELVPELIAWLSAEALECGFFTLFKKEEEQINRFIAHNRQPWIKTLQQLVYILIQTIAVIHNKTKVFRGGPVYGSLNWIDQWPESYEYWYQNYKNPLDYIETIVLNSFDIVMAWLFDHLARSLNGMTNVWGYNTNVWKHTYRNQWALTNDSDIVCAMDSYYTVVDYNNMMMSYILHYYKNMITVIMEDYFVECTVKGECKGPYNVDIKIGVKYSDTFVKIPSISCVFTCNKILSKNEKLENIAYQAYAHAHMTTEVAHELYCSHANLTERNGKIEVTMQCYPLIAEKYIMERQYKICKSDDCKWPCCKVDRSLKHCVNVTIFEESMPEPEYEVTVISLRKDMTMLPDL